QQGMILLMVEAADVDEDLGVSSELELAPDLESFTDTAEARGVDAAVEQFAAALLPPLAEQRRGGDLAAGNALGRADVEEPAHRGQIRAPGSARCSIRRARVVVAVRDADGNAQRGRAR